MSFVRDNMAASLPRLKKYAIALTHRSSQEADDLVQQTCLEALKYEHQFSGGPYLAKWMCRIMERVYSSAARKVARRLDALSRPTHPCARRSVAPPIETAQQPLQERGSLLLDDLKRAIKRIPVERRQTVLLLGDDSLSWAEIGKIVGAGPGCVRDRIYKGRKQLKALMA
jgi:RNA polymerase sigma-70 factor, ECF subfamily